ncbi:MAG: hypothetical protein ACFFB0_14825 [Promethearchaeota archaeon]
MKEEKILARRSTTLRKNNSKDLIINLNQINFKNIFLINGTQFLTKNISKSHLIVKPHDFYMIFNHEEKPITVTYNQDISKHPIIYDPFKYEYSERIDLTPEMFFERYDIPKNYVSTLPKWYSFKFSYSNYNLIFLRPEFGLSIQIHKDRNEFWEILEGEPILIIGNKVHYFVQSGTKLQNPRNSYHSIINPNKQKNKFVIIKEKWTGKFDENDIERVFNPNHYE